MGLQIDIDGNGHFFLDTTLGVQVGQAWQSGGRWQLEVNDQTLECANFKEAVRLFLAQYKPAKVGPAIGAFDDYDAGNDIRVIDLSSEADLDDL
jgi:hypothetical protein